jgi:uncharacterized membrane protein
MAKKKFETNPLDPEFPAKAAESAAVAPAYSPAPEIEDPPRTATPETQVLNQGDPVTRVFDEPPVTDQATRKFEESNFAAYQSPFNGQNVPGPYQAPKPLFAQESPTRKVSKIGLPENILVALPYVPFYIGLIGGLLELFFVPKSEQKVRFHAAQGVAAHIAILVISAILGGMSHVTRLAETGDTVFSIVSTVFLIVFVVKAYQGKPIHIEFVDDLTNWLEDKIKPSE